MHASLGSRSASGPAGVVLLATTVGILGCGGGATVPEDPDEPEIRYGLLEVTLVEEGATRDWGASSWRSSRSSGIRNRSDIWAASEGSPTPCGSRTPCPPANTPS